MPYESGRAARDRSDANRAARGGSDDRAARANPARDNPARGNAARGGRTTPANAQPATAPTPGQTKDAGWEVGVRQTVAAPVEQVWAFVLGDGLPIWLGPMKSQLPTEKGAAFQTDDDISGRILSFTDGLRIRLSWQPGEWDHDSTLQLTVRAAEHGAAEQGTTIAFHQERLTGREERKIMLGHWKEVVQQLGERLDGERLDGDRPKREPPRGGRQH